MESNIRAKFNSDYILSMVNGALFVRHEPTNKSVRVFDTNMFYILGYDYPDNQLKSIFGIDANERKIKVINSIISFMWRG